MLSTSFKFRTDFASLEDKSLTGVSRMLMIFKVPVERFILFWSPHKFYARTLEYMQKATQYLKKIWYVFVNTKLFPENLGYKVRY